MFWHLIGFWGFVSNVLLPPSNPVIRSDTAPATKVQTAQPNSALPNRVARPRQTKGAPGSDALAGSHDTDLQPSSGLQRVTSASE